MISICFIALIAAVQAVTMRMPSNWNDAVVMQKTFSIFQQRFEKVYETEEEEQLRFGIFRNNLVEIDQLNRRAKSINSTARYGITLFADITSEEFRSKWLMREKIQTVSREAVMRVREARGDTGRSAVAVGAPKALDYREHGLVTPVKNQGQCGSCWAFSVTEEVESKWIQAGKATNTTIALAPQQIVDCDDTSMGCGGGEPGSAYDYVINAGGQESNTSYPYQATDGNCRFNKNKVVAKVKSWKAATSWYSETTLVKHLNEWGAPLSICVDAASWQHYTHGVLSHMECAIIDVLDHCVQLVGYNEQGSTPYYMVRNSWTTKWGIEGYIHLEMWEDTCGLANQATSCTVA